MIYVKKWWTHKWIKYVSKFVSHYLCKEKKDVSKIS